MSEYRCTRVDLYAAGSVGFDNPAGRQGHYITAENEDAVRSEMKRRFPGDLRFTVELWESAGVRVNCPTCCRPASAPYRAHWHGKIVQGCIDACHTGHLIPGSDSCRWHNRPEAKKWRKESAARLRKLLA